MQIEVPAVGLGLRPPTRPRGEAPTRGRRGPGDCWLFAAVGARGREDCSSRPSYRRAVANPAGCRCAPPGGGAPGRPRERGEGSRPRAGRPTRVELERGKLADCRYQPSRRRSVVVKQGVRTIEESRRGGGVGAGHPMEAEPSKNSHPPFKSFAGSSCWRATAWGRGKC